MKEEAVLFGEGGELSGIVTDPDEQAGSGHPAFIFLNSGVIHRIGPNRLSVRIARSSPGSDTGPSGSIFPGSAKASRMGTADRFDLRERWIRDTREAIGFLERERGDRRFVLIGSCSGAAFSFLTACADSRVIGTVLINLSGPKVPLRYYLRLALFQRNIWSRLMKFRLKSGVSLQRTSGGYGPTEISRDLRRLAERGTKLLLVFCEWDPGFAYYSAFLKRRIASSGADTNPRVEIIRGMNHDFDLLHGQENLIRIVRDWAPQVARGCMHK